MSICVCPTSASWASDRVTLVETPNAAGPRSHVSGIQVRKIKVFLRMASTFDIAIRDVLLRGQGDSRQRLVSRTDASSKLPGGGCKARRQPKSTLPATFHRIVRQSASASVQGIHAADDGGGGAEGLSGRWHGWGDGGDRARQRDQGEIRRESGSSITRGARWRWRRSTARSTSAPSPMSTPRPGLKASRLLFAFATNSAVSSTSRSSPSPRTARARTGRGGAAAPGHGAWCRRGRRYSVDRAHRCRCGAHINTCFDLAQAFDKDVSMLLDDAGDPGLRTLEMMAVEAIRRNWQGRALAHHCRAMSLYPRPYVQRLARVLRNAPRCSDHRSPHGTLARSGQGIVGGGCQGLPRAR